MLLAGARLLSFTSYADVMQRELIGKSLLTRIVI